MADPSAYEFVFVKTPFFLSCEQAIRATLEKHCTNIKATFGNDRAQDSIVSISPDHIAAMFAKPLPALEESVGGRLVHREFEEPGLSVTPYLIWRKDNPNPYVEAFVEAVQGSMRG